MTAALKKERNVRTWVVIPVRGSAKMRDALVAHLRSSLPMAAPWALARDPAGIHLDNQVMQYRGALNEINRIARDFCAGWRMRE